jgi:hypothetical protein
LNGSKNKGIVVTGEKDKRMHDWDKQTFKEAVKEAIKEWLDEKYAQFGRWSLHGLLAAALGGLIYALGWIKWH